MVQCWFCRRTKEEILAELKRMNIPHEEKEIVFMQAEESDYPNLHYCSVCDSILADFILKEGVVTEEDEE